MFTFKQFSAKSLAQFENLPVGPDTKLHQLSKGAFTGWKKLFHSDPVRYSVNYLEPSVSLESITGAHDLGMHFTLSKNNVFIDGTKFKNNQVCSILPESKLNVLTQKNSAFIYLILDKRSLKNCCSDGDYQQLLSIYQNLTSPKEVSKWVIRELCLKLSYLIDEIEAGEVTEDDKVVIEDFKSSLIDELLKFSDAKKKKIRINDQTRIVKKSLDYIQHTDLCQMNINALSGEVNHSRRTLENAFKNILGVSPKQVIVSIRLQKIRQELLNNRGTAISFIARKYGVTHMGRFSRDYQQMFGELPRETVSKLASARRVPG